MEPQPLFSASVVAQLSDGVCGLGKFVRTPSGKVGRIVAPAVVQGSNGRWWLVKVGRVVVQFSEAVLDARS